MMRGYFTCSPVYLSQLLNAADIMQKHHDALIAAGAKWDGQDGYMIDDEVLKKLDNSSTTGKVFTKLER